MKNVVEIYQFFFQAEMIFWQGLGHNYVENWQKKTFWKWS